MKLNILQFQILKIIDKVDSISSTDIFKEFPKQPKRLIGYNLRKLQNHKYLFASEVIGNMGVNTYKINEERRKVWDY